MANVSLADQLDDAIEIMIAESDSAPPRVDLKIGELLGIAAELRLLPDPAFRAALKTELLGHSSVATTLTRVEWKPARDAEEAILPTLFGVGSGHYPVGRGNFLISTALHLAMLLAVAASGLVTLRLVGDTWAQQRTWQIDATSASSSPSTTSTSPPPCAGPVRR